MKKKSVLKTRRQGLKKADAKPAPPVPVPGVYITAEKEYKDGDEIFLGEVEPDNEKLFNSIVKSITNISLYTAPNSDNKTGRIASSYEIWERQKILKEERERKDEQQKAKRRQR